MKWLLAVSIGLSAMLFVGRSSPYERAVDSTVEISAGEGSGMGVFVGKHSVLTAAHVIAGEKQITIRCHGGEPMPAVVVASDEGKDLALLRVAGEGRPMSLSSAARPGEPLFIVGASYGFSGGHARRIYEATAIFPRHDLAARVLEMDCTVNLGDSGAPVVDESGRLAGVCSHIDQFRYNAYMAIDVSEIRAFLKRGEKWTR